MHESEDTLKLENQLSFSLYACSKELIRAYKPLLESLNLTYTQYLAMTVLWEFGQTNSKVMGCSISTAAPSRQCSKPSSKKAICAAAVASSTAANSSSPSPTKATSSRKKLPTFLQKFPPHSGSAKKSRPSSPRSSKSSLPD